FNTKSDPNRDKHTLSAYRQAACGCIWRQPVRVLSMVQARAGRHFVALLLVQVQVGSREREASAAPAAGNLRYSRKRRRGYNGVCPHGLGSVHATERARIGKASAATAKPWLSRGVF